LIVATRILAGYRDATKHMSDVANMLESWEAKDANDTKDSKEAPAVA
jgi:hypothetical protein